MMIKFVTDDDNKLYYELAGHPLCCYDETSKCQSSLRVLRAAATHFSELRKLKRIVYEAKREDFKIESIDTALCAGDFEKLCKLWHVTLQRSIQHRADK